MVQILSCRAPSHALRRAASLLILYSTAQAVPWYVAFEGRG